MVVYSEDATRPVWIPPDVKATWTCDRATCRARAHGNGHSRQMISPFLNFMALILLERSSIVNKLFRFLSLRPPRLHGLDGDFLPPLCRELSRPALAALEPAEPSQRHRRGILLHLRHAELIHANLHCMEVVISSRQQGQRAEASLGLFHPEASGQPRKKRDRLRLFRSWTVCALS